MRHPVFHTFKIGDLNFLVMMKITGPYVACENDGQGGRLIAIARSLSIRYETPRYNPFRHFPYDGRTGWWLIKYDNEYLLDLTSLSDDQAHEFAAEMGLPIRSSRPKPPHVLFNHCPAWEALVEWAKAHPRLVKRYKDSKEFFDWYAQYEAQVTDHA